MTDVQQQPQSEFTHAQKSVIKELGRRRVFVIFLAFLAFALGNTITEESDILLHALDDYLIIALAVIGVVIFAVTWKKQSFLDLRKVNNIATIISVIFIPIVIFAITQEINDPADFGNEIPSLLFAAVLVINRFV